MCVTLSSLCTVDLLGSCHHDSETRVVLWQTKAHSLVYQELFSNRSWQLFFMTNIKMICKDTKHKEREDSDAVRRRQCACLFALIVAMDVLGH